MEQKNVGIIVLVILIIIVLLFFGSGAFGGEGEEGETLSGGGPGSPCSSNDDCNEGLICVDGICQDDSCGPGGVCPPGFICIGDTCVDGSCGPEDPCPEGFVCIGGFCFPSDEAPCGGPEDEECPPGEECVDGSCEDIPSSCEDDDDCPLGQECVDESCVDLIPCDDEDDCPDGFECIDGYCEEPECDCTSDLDCADLGFGYVCNTEGCCEYAGLEYLDCEIKCGEPEDPECPEGQTCISGCCTEESTFTIPSFPGPMWLDLPGSDDFCDGCPAEDSIPSMMFLGPDIEEGTTTITVVAEQLDKTRDVVEDATVFVEVLPNDGAPRYICRVLTDSSGSALFDYSEYSECEDIGCKLKFTFCCADISDGCLIPVCLNDPEIVDYEMVSPCDSSVATWETQVTVDGEFINIYPVIEMISIPPKPKFLGAAFTMELCLPILVIFGLLSAAMFSSGRNPLQMFSIYRGRFKRAPQRAIRARGYTANFKALANSIAGAVQSMKGAEGKGLKEKAKTLSKGRTLGAKVKGAKKSIGKMRGVAAQGRAIKGGKIGKIVPRGAKSTEGTGATADLSGGQKGSSVSRASMDVGDHMDMLQMTGGTVGGSMRAFGAAFGTAALGKLLTGSGLTSWVMYGTGENFQGLISATTGRLKSSNAAALQKQMATLLVAQDMNVKVATDKDGNPMQGPNGEPLYVVTYNDVSAVDPEKSTIVLGADNPDAEQCPVVESKPLTAAEVEKVYAEVAAPAMMLGAMSAQIVAQDMVEKGNVLHDAQQDAAAAGHENYGVSVAEPISADAAGTIVSSPDQKVTGSDAAAAIVKAESLTTSGGTIITDGKKFGEWANNMNTQANAGESISNSDLRMGAEIYHKAVDDLGAESVAKNENLATLGAALVNATGAVESREGTVDINGEAATSESAGFGIYVQSMVADANTQAADDASGADAAQFRNAQADAMGALGNTYDAAVGLEEKGEGGRTNLTEMVETFGADKRGEMGDPSRYNDNQEYAQAMNNHLIEHQSFLLQNDLDDGKTAVGDYLSTSVFRAEQPEDGFRSNKEYMESSRVKMINQLDPNREARHSFQDLNPGPGGAGKAKPWKMNEAQYTEKLQSAQHYLEKTHRSSQLDSQAGSGLMLVAYSDPDAYAETRFQNVGKGVELDLAKPSQVRAYVNSQARDAAAKTGVNPDGTPVAGAPNITNKYLDSEAQKIYANAGLAVDFAGARESAKTRAAEEMLPLQPGYAKPRDEIAQKSRESAYNTMKETVDAQRPAPPVVNYNQDAAQHDLYLALGAHPQHSKSVTDAMKKEFDEVRKVEAARKEQHKLETLADQRRRDIELSSAAKPPTEAERQKAEEKYRKAGESVDKQLGKMRKAQKERDAITKKRQDEYNKRHYGTTTPPTRQSVREREAEAKKIGEAAAKEAAQKAQKARAKQAGEWAKKQRERKKKEEEARKKK
ncbi:MAG: hypothetical protein GY852_02885 [bacterium]|nr:hypothetical protein [bacterium]